MHFKHLPYTEQYTEFQCRLLANVTAGTEKAFLNSSDCSLNIMFWKQESEHNILKTDKVSALPLK